MNVFGVNIPNKALTDIELEYYVKELKIPHFRGVFMRDTLPKKPNEIECGIVNLNTSKENGSHWTAYFKKAQRRIYFDSYGQITPIEIQNYLKTREERDIPIIQRNTDIVQPFGTSICGHLCLFVLKALSLGWTFQEVLNHLDGYTQGNREIPST